jgi:signal transduction histidine kinase/ActR/RegA family two-component response regulator
VTPSNARGDRALPWFVFAVFFVVTLLATSYVWRTTRAADRARFDNAVQVTRDAILSRLDTYLNVLTGTRGLVVSDPAIPRDELRAYIRALNVQVRYPGIRGIGFLLRITPDEVANVEREMQLDGDPEFHIRPPGVRDEYHAIVLLEPSDAMNRKVLGYDMFSDPVRRSAMERARDTGRAAVSSAVTLVQDADLPNRQPGFLIFTPLYATGTTPRSLEERRSALIGYIYAPFRAHDFFEGIFGSQRRPEVGYEVRDGNQLMYRTGNLPREPRFTARDTLSVAGRTWTLQWISRRPAGGTAVLLTTGTFAGGVAISILLFLLLRTQLNAREQAERTAERLRISEAELQRANRAKDDFLAVLSHELRTPMTSIMGWSQMLGDEHLEGEAARTAIDAIRRSARVQAQLIDDLLDVSRITAGKMSIESRTVELVPVVTAAVETVRGMANAKEVRVTTDLAPRVCVNGDARRLQQIVWNLLSNAVKFTPRGGDVFVSLREANGHAVIEVRDTGQGIDLDFMPHIFERFRQADSSTTRAHMGLGLGLAIVRHLVELHGGTIAAESKGPGTGATFRVRIPVLAGAGDAASAEPKAETDLRGVRLLLVDDDEEVRDYVTAVFRSFGVEVRSAPAARAALDLLRDWPADVLLTDLAMPGADGFDLLHWIRTSDIERVRALPVIALTAFAMADDRQRVEEGGFQGFVAKPVEPSRLREAVAEVLATPYRPSVRR